MRKSIVIAIVLFIAVLSYSASIAHSQAFKSSDIQENTVTISGGSYDNLPLTDDGKIKFSLVLFSITLIFIVIQRILNNIDVVQTNRRYLWMISIFYKSNYLVKAL